jgi:hypothetical protein
MANKFAWRPLKTRLSGSLTNQDLTEDQQRDTQILDSFV